MTTGDIKKEMKFRRKKKRQMMRAFPEIKQHRNTRFICPQRLCEHPIRVGLTGLIIHLNDDHGWSRERIAGEIERL